MDRTGKKVVENDAGSSRSVPEQSLSPRKEPMKKKQPARKGIYCDICSQRLRSKKALDSHKDGHKMEMAASMLQEAAQRVSPAAVQHAQQIHEEHDSFQDVPNSLVFTGVVPVPAQGQQQLKSVANKRQPLLALPSPPPQPASPASSPSGALPGLAGVNRHPSQGLPLLVPPPSSLEAASDNVLADTKGFSPQPAQPLRHSPNSLGGALAGFAGSSQQPRQKLPLPLPHPLPPLEVVSDNFQAVPEGLKPQPERPSPKTPTLAGGGYQNSREGLSLLLPHQPPPLEAISDNIQAVPEDFQPQPAPPVQSPTLAGDALPGGGYQNSREEVFLLLPHPQPPLEAVSENIQAVTKRFRPQPAPPLPQPPIVGCHNTRQGLPLRMPPIEPAAADLLAVLERFLMQERDHFHSSSYLDHTAKAEEEDGGIDLTLRL